jgi:hypothetical protein
MMRLENFKHLILYNRVDFLERSYKIDFKMGA